MYQMIVKNRLLLLINIFDILSGIQVLKAKKKKREIRVTISHINSESVNCRIAQKYDIGDSGVVDFYMNLLPTIVRFSLRSSPHRRDIKRHSINGSLNNYATID